MIEQGYDMDPSLLYQDNMSAILLETNGRASSSKRTMSNRADVDGHKHKAKARNCLLSV